MSIEDKLGETMRRALNGEPLPRDVYEAFERRAQRSQRTRMVAAVASAAIVAAAATFGVMKLATPDRRIAVAASPSTEPSQTPSPTPEPASPSPSASTDPYAGWHTYTGPNYAIRYPSDWNYSVWEGHDEFRPNGTSSLAKGEPTYAVSLYMLEGQRYNGSGCMSADVCPPQVTESRGEIDGHPYLRYEQDNSDGTKRIVYRIEWYGAGTCSNGPCDGPRSLEASITIGSRALDQQYGDLGDQVVRTIATLT